MRKGLKDLRLHTATSHRCNNACLFCMEFDPATGRRHGSRLPLERTYLTRERLLAQIKPSHRGLPVLFTGGEPTLNPELSAMVFALRERGFREIGLQTNGRRLSDPAFAIRLLRAGVNRVSVSLHGSQASVHETLTRARGSWAQTRKGLEVVLALKRRWPWLHVATTTTVAAANLDDLQPLLNLLLPMRGLDVIVLNPLSFEGNAVIHFDALAVRYSELAAAFRRARADMGEAGAEELERVTWIDFPPCVMPEMASRIGTFERVILIGPEGDSSLLPPKLWFAGAKAPACALCVFNGACTGISPRYIERFGWSEFVPVPSCATAGRRE